ncbi:MAG: D-isomer specific 2-hydroxyacid dehydrogenase family protein [Micrococcales bacterium]
MHNNKVSILPKSFPEYEAAVIAAGGDLVNFDDSVRAVIWTDYSKPNELATLLSTSPQIEWVQLPFAGVDAFSEVIKHPIRFTSAKGAYRKPVAEHALLLMMALGRVIPERVKAKTWGKNFAVSLYDSRILIIGGGGITEELLLLLAPFGAQVSVIRNRDLPLKGASSTKTFSHLDDELQRADFVVLAAALTDETRGLINAKRLALMKETAYLVNIARGPMVVTQDLIDALNSGAIAGAALDVTDPEPLPDGHQLWDAKNILITPHTADTRTQVVPLFSERIDANVKAYLGLGEWVGVVDAELGY